MPNSHASEKSGSSPQLTQLRRTGASGVAKYTAAVRTRKNQEPAKVRGVTELSRHGGSRAEVANNQRTIVRLLMIKSANAQKQHRRLNLADLKQLPPVTIIAAEVDPLKSDSDMLAE